MRTSGSCWAASKDWSEDKQMRLMLQDFHTMVIRDGIDPGQAHGEFLKIDECARTFQ